MEMSKNGERFDVKLIFAFKKHFFYLQGVI